MTEIPKHEPKVLDVWVNATVWVLVRNELTGELQSAEKRIASSRDEGRPYGITHLMTDGTRHHYSGVYFTPEEAQQNMVRLRDEQIEYQKLKNRFKRFVARILPLLHKSQ